MRKRRGVRARGALIVSAGCVFELQHVSNLDDAGQQPGAGAPRARDWPGVGIVRALEASRVEFKSSLLGMALGFVTDETQDAPVLSLLRLPQFACVFGEKVGCKLCRADIFFR